MAVSAAAMGSGAAGLVEFCLSESLPVVAILDLLPFDGALFVRRAHCLALLIADLIREDFSFGSRDDLSVERLQSLDQRFVGGVRESAQAESHEQETEDGFRPSAFGHRPDKGEGSRGVHFRTRGEDSILRPLPPNVGGGCGGNQNTSQRPATRCRP